MLSKEDGEYHLVEKQTKLRLWWKLTCQLDFATSIGMCMISNWRYCQTLGLTKTCFWSKLYLHSCHQITSIGHTPLTVTRNDQCITYAVDMLTKLVVNNDFASMGPLPDTQNCGLHMHRECRDIFFPATYMLHGTCVTHVPWCMPGSLTSGFLWSQWREKRFQHSRRMRNPQFYISEKRPITSDEYCIAKLISI